jgi:hypothetical protein
LSIETRQDERTDRTAPQASAEERSILGCIFSKETLGIAALVIAGIWKAGGPLEQGMPAGREAADGRPGLVSSGGHLASAATAAASAAGAERRALETIWSAASTAESPQLMEAQLKLEAGAKLAFAQMLDASLREQNPDDFTKLLQWQKTLFALEKVNPEIAKEHAAAARAHVEAFLADCGKWQDSNRPLQELDTSMRRVFQLHAWLNADQKLECFKAITASEVVLHQRWELIDEYMNGNLEYAKRKGGADRVRSEENIDNGGLLPVLDRWILRGLRDDLAKCEGFTKEGHKWFYDQKTDTGNRRWIVELDRVFSFLGDSRYITLRRVDDPRVFATMEEIDFRLKIKSKSVPNLVVETQKSADQEKANAPILKKFDLPAEGKISYLRIFPSDFDQVVSGTVQTSMMLSTALKLRYGDRVETPAPLFEESAREALIKSIERSYDGGKGSKFFLIDMYNHGSESYVCFKDKLTADDLVRIAKRFPDCKFAFTSIACFGGGLRRGLMDELAAQPKLKERIALFTQTKPNVPNYLATVEKHSNPYAGTTYYYQLVRALMDPSVETFGEAVYRADTETKDIVPLDAESVIDGKLISQVDPNGRRHEVNLEKPSKWKIT